MDYAKDMYGDFEFDKSSNGNSSKESQRITYDDWAKEQSESNYTPEVLR